MENHLIELFFKFCLELSFWGVVAGCVVIVFLVVKDLKRWELVTMLALLLVALLLRLKYSIFAPIHEEDHFIDIILNIFNNFTNGSFFVVPNVYFASSGFPELFYQKIFFFLPKFNVYYLYYINLLLSVIRGVLLFYLVRVSFNNKTIAFLALVIYSFFPIDIKLSATETLFHVPALTLLLFLSLLFLVIKNPRNIYIFLVLSVYLANIFSRCDFSAFFMITTLLIFIYLLVFNKDFRKIFVKNHFVKIVITVIIIVSFLFINYILIPNIGQGMSTLDEISYFYNNITDYFSIKLLFDEAQNNRFIFFHYFFSPLYFYLFFKISILLCIFLRKHFLYCFITLVFLLLNLAPVWLISDIFRKVYPVWPLLIGQAAFGFYWSLKIVKLKDKTIMIVGFIVVSLFIIQNIDFLNMTTARRKEQDFLIKHLNTIPHNSLLLTIANKGYEESIFEEYRNYPPLEVHGLEFPSYLTRPVSKTIDVMDIYKEYNFDIIKTYDHVYYFRGLYAYHENVARKITRQFENQHKLSKIEEIAVFNYALDGLRASVKGIKSGDSLSIDADNPILNLGFYMFQGEN